jgi:hypothetical protein
MRRAIQALRESADADVAPDREDLVVSFEDLNSLLGLDDVKRIETEYLTPEQLGRKYRPAAT